MTGHRVTIVPHTHWDREWYQPFAVFQARLVEVVDEVLDLLDEDPDFEHFMLDGQAVVLEDYLALRPDNEARIRANVESGRLAIGPWYTLADEFLASPESLLRNLELGLKECRRFGSAMDVVYTPDSFGHISQLPLLAAGFGFDSIVFERGVGDEGERLGGEFRWSSADCQHSVLAVHLITTYSSAAGIGYRDWSRYRDFDPQRAASHASKALFGGSAPIGMESWLDESLQRIPGGSSAYASGRSLLLLNGSDHLPPQADLPRVVQILNERIDEASFRIGRLREFIEAVESEATELPRYRGEFRGSRYHHILSGVFSARMYLKQANFEAQRWLERLAEPLSSIAHSRGAPYPDAVLEGAWKQLLKNHCHDSICGCSIDQVHDEMMPRFASVTSASSHLSRKAIAHLGGGEWRVQPPPRIEPELNLEEGHDGEPCLAVFNPHPWTWEGVLEATVALSDSSSPFDLVDAAGRRLGAQVRIEEPPLPGDARGRRRVARLRWHATLGPLSVSGFRLAHENDAASDRGPTQFARNEVLGGSDGARQGDGVLENESLRVELRGGELVLKHLRSGREFPLRLHLEDSGDAGDEYDYSPVEGDEPVELELLAQGVEQGGDELEGYLRFEGRIEVPSGLAADRRDRVGKSEIPFQLLLSLRSGESFLRLDLELDNRAEDHRLRLVVETDVVTDQVAVEGHFDVLERPLEQAVSETWFQRPSGTNHQRRFLAVEDGNRGVAVMNAGLPEYEAQRSDNGSRIAVTLLRCVGWLSRNDLSSRPEGAGPALPTPGAQCPGVHTFRLGIAPYEGDWDQPSLLQAVERFSLPPLVETAPHLARGEAWLEVPPELLLSALKASTDGEGQVVRLWNPCRHRVDGTLRLAHRPAMAARVAFDETILEELPASREMEISLRPKEVLTLLLRWNPTQWTEVKP